MKNIGIFMFVAIGIAMISSIGSSPLVHLVFIVSMPLAVFLLSIYVLQDPSLLEVV